MTTPLTLEPPSSALLVMDIQQTVVEMVPAEGPAVLAHASRLLEAARRSAMRVIHVVVGFRPGPEVSPRNQAFHAVRESGRFAEGSPGTAIHPAVAPATGEVVVTKHRVSAFAGTDLEMILRAHRIETLVLAGLATSGVVLSTVRHATDADYRVVVVEDACADRDPEVHRVLMEKVFPRATTVVKTDVVTSTLGAA